MRTLQHIAWTDKIAEAKNAGKKVTMLCGARKYPMSEMADSIPTCHWHDLDDHHRWAGVVMMSDESPIFDALSSEPSYRDLPLYDAIAAAAIDDVMTGFDILLIWAATADDE